MDPTTFGGTKAAIVLANLLTQKEYKRYTSQVGRNLIHFCTTLKCLDDIKNISVQRHMKYDLYENFKKIDLPTKLKSYTINVAHHFFIKSLNNKSNITENINDNIKIIQSSLNDLINIISLYGEKYRSGEAYEAANIALSEIKSLCLK